MQVDRKRAQEANSRPLTPSASISGPEGAHPDVIKKSAKRKRHVQGEDEIDAVFNASLGKRMKKAALSRLIPREPEKMNVNQGESTNGLQIVLGAIKSAPKDERGNKKQNKRSV